MNSGLSYLITTVSDFLILRKFIMSHDLLNDSLDLVCPRQKLKKKQELTISRGNLKIKTRITFSVHSLRDKL